MQSLTAPLATSTTGITALPLPVSIASQLAPEILHIMFCNFDDCREHLASLSLVCKAWLPLCRHILFAEMEFREDFTRFLASSPHAALTIAPHIRKVFLRGDVIPHEIAHEIWHSILCLLNITSLRIERIRLDTLIHWHSSSIAARATPSEIPPLGRLYQLNLRSIHCSSFTVFAEFLHSFCSLQELTLDTVSWDTTTDITTDDGGLPDVPLNDSSLTKLLLSFCPNRMLLNWLLYGVISESLILGRDPLFRRSFHSLTTTSLSDILPQEADIVGVILATAGESLEHLEIGLLVHNFDDHDHDFLLRSLPLAHNSRLKTIIINQITLFQFPSYHEPSPMNSPYRWIPEVLSAADHASVHTVSFKIWLSAEDQLDILPWPTVNAVLTDLGLSKLNFDISGVGIDRDLVGGWFMKRLALDSAKITVEYNFAL